MKRYCLIAIIAVFLLHCTTGIQAQKSKQAEKLIEAIETNNLDKALIIVENIDFVNYQDNSGNSLLIQASSKGFTEVCRKLIEKGAKLDLQDKDGSTALMIAIVGSQKEVIRLLLVKGANLNLQDNKGMTALIMASIMGEIEVVKLLLNNGANTNFKSNEGKTAIDYAPNNEIKALLSNYVKN